MQMLVAFSEFSVHGPDDQDAIEDLEAQGLLVDVEEVLEARRSRRISSSRTARLLRQPLDEHRG